MSNGLLWIGGNQASPFDAKPCGTTITDRLMEFCGTSTRPDAGDHSSAAANTRRTARASGAGDTVVVTPISGNRDEKAVDYPNNFIIDRARPRHHLSCGFALDRCVGSRLAGMQLPILREQMMASFLVANQIEQPNRIHYDFIYRLIEIKGAISG